jgi:hypothetical protein
MADFQACFVQLAEAATVEQFSFELMPKRLDVDITAVVSLCAAWPSGGLLSPGGLLEAWLLEPKVIGSPSGTSASEANRLTLLGLQVPPLVSQPAATRRAS